MNAKSVRLFSTLMALGLGVILVIVLSFMGKESRGPLENLFSLTSETVGKVENKMIIAAREDKRENRLKWLQPYFTNRSLLLNPPKILLGAFDNNTKESFESVIDLEDSLRTTFPFMHIYTAWGSKPEHEFPAKQVKSILELGSIPVITWEPWLTSFDPDKYPQLKPMDKRDKNGLADVAKGTYDFYLTQWADEAKKINGPIFLRVGHEMNDPYRYPWGPQNNTAKDFIAAWKHIRAVFKKEGANNIVWVWSPHPAYGFFKEFYPGDSLVDYVGIGTLNYGTVATWSKWWSFKEIFGKYYDKLSAFNKPIMLTEFGSLAVGGNRGQWFAQALDSMPQQYPAVKSVLFFHFSDDKTTTQQTINWYIKDDPEVTKAIIAAVKGWKQ